MHTELLRIQPGELKFPFELKKQVSASIQLVNSSEYYVAFKVKTTSPKKYCVRPNTGIVLPYGSADVTVTMQAQREAPPDMQCKDKFLVQSVIAPPGTLAKDVTQDLFNKEPGRDIHEAKLKVLYVPPQPPSPITESNEEGLSPKTFPVVDNGRHHFLPQDPARSALTALTEERNSAIQHSLRLQEELANTKIVGAKSGGVGTAEAMKAQKLQTGFSFLFVILVGFLGMLVGYLIGVSIPT
ncbi:unnamed protein product [Sphagnum jensenii]|uniref:MSP domain-containing protein n=1 Tax=Sphagnum jensenii TaxID=128206 RepID=A0ABP0WJ45_9BRYO